MKEDGKNCREIGFVTFGWRSYNYEASILINHNKKPEFPFVLAERNKNCLWQHQLMKLLFVLTKHD